jgi:hypothetical protein
MLLLRREFNRRLTFLLQPKLDNTAVTTAMVAAMSGSPRRNRV